MKFVNALIVFLILSLYQSNAQIPVGHWRTHFAYTAPDQVCETKTKVFAVSDGSLYYYDKNDRHLNTFTKIDGLNDSFIKFIRYVEASDLLLIIYANNNIDLLTSKGIINIPDIKDKTLSGSKQIYNISITDTRAYLATAFGIVVVNLDKKEVSETYFLKQEIKSVCLFDSKIYAGTNNGILIGDLSKNLSDYNNWVPGYSIVAKDIVTFQKKLFALIKGQGVFKLDQEANRWDSFISDWSVIFIKAEKNCLFANGKESTTLYITRDILKPVESVPGITLNDVSANNSDGSYWGVNAVQYLFSFKTSAAGYQIQEQKLKPDGLLSNTIFRLYATGDQVMLVGGGRWLNRYDKPGLLSTFKNEKWSHLDNAELSKVTGFAPRDFVDVIVNPSNPDNLFICAWGDGLYELNKDKAPVLYNYKNSKIQSAIENNPDYHRIDGLAFDKDNNLWMTNSLVKNAVVVKKANNTWVSLFYPELNGISILGNVLITQNNIKVINRIAKDKGVFFIDDAGTLDDTRDDKTKLFTSFVDQDGKVVNPDFYLSMVEDRNGALWIGTSGGPIIIYNPSRFRESDFYCTKIKIPRNDGSGLADFLLDGIQINEIAIDGGNRKWIATEGSGVYLISEDGLQTIQHFETDNSPLPSNIIKSLVVNSKTGEVFFATDHGMVSYRSDATEGSESFSDVYAFPNPVRPDYEGLITITGLMESSRVKITDITGNLMFDGISEGGQVSWNGRKANGEKVKTGVYLVFASSKDGSSGVATKILFVR